MKNLDKRVGAWVIMDIYSYEEINQHLVRIIGPIIDSNFLDVCEQSTMPVMAGPFENVDLGSRVKLVYFTSKGELEAFRNRKSAGFDDDGMRYFIWNDEGWEILYEE